MITHLACIMDGNRRWARLHTMESWEGHRHGAQAIKRVAQFCLDNNITHLSLYAFSLENFNRSAQELHYLFELLFMQLLNSEIDNNTVWAQGNGIRIRFVGDRTQFPPQLVAALDTMESDTAAGTRLTMHVLFCYGGRQEIVHGVKEVARQMLEGSLSISQVTDEFFKTQLWMGDIPDPDLIIRTGGQHRLSNFLLYQAAYSELYFTDCLWPDITKEQLEEAVTFFDTCKRNYGS